MLEFAPTLSALLAFLQSQGAFSSVSNPPSPAPSDLHNRGWGFALVIIILAIAANVTAFTIHKKTYLQPSSKAPASAEH